MKPAPAPWGYYADGNFVEVDRKIFAYAGYYPPFQIRGEAGVMHDVVELGAVEKVANKRSKAAKGNTSAKAGTKSMGSVVDAANALPNVSLYRNNNGEAWQGSLRKGSNGTYTLIGPRRIKFGLKTGSSDLIGWTTVTITPDMVGRNLAIFTAIESKSGKSDEKAHQEEWREKVTAAGGIARVLRSAGEVTREVFEP